MSDGGRLLKIWIKRGKRGVMDEVSEVLAEEDRGLESNANRGGRRQVTLLEKEKWDRMMQRLDANLDPSTRRANLLIEGVDLFDSRGRTIQIGDCRIEICGETRPCERMDEALPGLRDAMDPEWRGGAYGRIKRGASIRVGDPVRWSE